MGIDRSLDDVVPAMKAKYALLQANCAAKGVRIQAYFTLRTPQQQAALWRQSRTASQVAAGIAKLRAQGCGFLADCIDKAGPSSGAWATNALPGYSWHNWGMAVDSMILNPQGHAVWGSNSENAADRALAQNGLKVLAAEAVALGLTAGYNFSTPDMDHVQLPAKEVPDTYLPSDVNEQMAARFPFE